MPDLTVWPTDGAAGSVSSETRWRKMAKLWFPSTVIDNVSGELAPSLNAGPTITVQAGACWIDGHYAELPAAQTVAATATGILVCRFTPADNRCELLYRDAATTPTQTDPTWELLIASMSGGVLTDRRTFQAAPVMTLPGGVTNVIADTGYLAAAAATVDFTGIPQTYTHLRASFVVRQTGTNTALSVGFNGDTTAGNYAITGGGAGTAAGTYFDPVVPVVGATANIAGVGQIEFPFYRNTLWFKGVQLLSNYLVTPAANNFVGLWRSTAAINRITMAPFAGSFAAGSRIVLYGIT